MCSRLLAQTSDTSLGGYLLRGKVVNVATGAGIPDAILFFIHTSTGASTDADGNFSILLDSLPADTLRAEALGYKARYITLKRDKHDYLLTIELDRSGKMLAEVTVGGKGEDPALALMRHVVQRKPYNDPARADNYSYEAYNRLEADLIDVTKKEFQKMPFLNKYSFIYDNLDTVSEAIPFLPIYLTETISQFFYRPAPKKQREFIVGSMAKGINNESITNYLGTLYQQVNIYKNYIPVFDKKYISPINDNGPFYYKYTIIDTQEAYGHEVYMVKFSPRRFGDKCFTGYLRIVDSIYAIAGFDMDVPKESRLNWVDKVNLVQDFAPVDSFWFLAQDRLSAHFTIYHSKTLPGFIGRKTTTYHNISINSTAADSVLNDSRWHEDVIRSDSSKSRAESWWQNTRPDKLTKNEAAINKAVDSINSMPITDIYKKTVNFFVSGVYDWGPIELGPYFYAYSSNSIEGNRYRLSLATPRKLKWMHITGFLAYGTKDKEYKYGGTGVWIIQRNPRIYLYGYAVHDLEQTLNYYDQIGSDNIFNSLLRKPGIPWKLAFDDEQRLEFYRQYYSGFSYRLIAEHRQYTPYQPLPTAGIFYDENGRPANYIINADGGVELRWAYKEKYVDGYYFRRDFGSKYPVLDLNVTTGGKGVLGSAYTYQKARFSVSEGINMPPFGRISYTVFMGKYFGTLPYALLEVEPGNEYYYYNAGAFELMNKYEFLTDRYAGFFIDHNIGGGVFNYIPLLRYLRWRQFWTVKGVTGSLSQANEALNFNKGYDFRSLSGNPYLELGTGISNIFGFVRVDFDWRVAPAILPTENRSQYFGVFVSAYFQF